MPSEVADHVDYELLSVPGLNDLQIAVIPSFLRSQQRDDVGTRYLTWTFSADSIFLPKAFVELYGWYAESSRETGTDVANQLFTDCTLRHSELVVVIPNGKHLATFENFLFAGEPLKTVVLTHLIKIGLPRGVPVPTQVISFKDSFVTGVQQCLDCLILRFRVQKKMVECTTFNQEGRPSGVGFYEVDLSKNRLSW